MLTAMWGVDGFHAVYLMASQGTFNPQYSFDNVLTHFLPEIFPQGRRHHALRLHCHLDNCRVHFLKASEQFFTENETVQAPHPPYNPDLAPWAFRPFGHVKTALTRHGFDQPEELFDATATFREEIQVSKLEGVFWHWVERVQWVLGHNGEYYHE
jgi:hypothetical protein